MGLFSKIYFGLFASSYCIPCILCIFQEKTSLFNRCNIFPKNGQEEIFCSNLFGECGTSEVSINSQQSHFSLAQFLMSIRNVYCFELMHFSLFVLGDCHATLNFVAVMDVPVIFICQNNGWEIGTVSSEHFISTLHI